MHGKYNRRRNPSPHFLGLKLGAGGALSSSDYAYLEQRAKDFVSILAKALAVPTYEFSSDGDSRDAIAKLVATALADKSSSRWTKARSYVFDRLPHWVGFGPVPGPFPAVPGP